MNNIEITEKPVEKTPWKRKSRAKKPKNPPVDPQDYLAEMETPTPSANIEYEESQETPHNYDPDFLSELNNNHETYEESIPEIKPRKSRAKKQVEYVEPENTPLYGKNKLVLIKRIEQYKLLFPQLANFHYSKDQEESELEAIIVEFQSLVEVSNEDAFIEESIFQSIKMCEGYSAKTRYDLSGLSLILKHNKGFTDILKVLHLKYATYLSVPPEIQCALIVSCSVAIVLNKNQNKSQRDAYLDEPINI